MAQYGRPSTDTVRESWENQAAGTATIYLTIDEVTASTADYIRSAQVPTADAYATQLTSVTDPVVHTGHIIRFQYAKDQAAGAGIDLVVQLRESYVSEVSQGTLIAGSTYAGISESWTSGTITCSTTEAALITNYAALYLRFTANQV